MIVIIHNNNNIKAIEQFGTAEKMGNDQFINEPIVKTLLKIAGLYPQNLIGWLHEDLKNSVDLSMWKSYIHHPLEMVSFEPSSKHYMSEEVEYIDMFSPYVNRSAMENTRYATWMMSSSAGLTYGKLLKEFEPFSNIKNFALFLVIAARKGMDKGLLPYSEPGLLKTETSIFKSELMDGKDFFSFIKTVHGEKWALYYLLLKNVYKINNSFGVLDYVKAEKYRFNTLNFSKIQSETSVVRVDKNDTIDIIIPTLGRKKYLYNVLKDLSRQTHLPSNIIIVEQNPDETTSTELEYLASEEWPFEIKHIFIHQLGACNARNIAISQIESKYTFFADDDIRIEPQTIANALTEMKTYGLSASTLAVYQQGESVKQYDYPVLWGTFGTCSSIVESRYAQNTFFDMALEFGYGEDMDYGDALRQKGCAITYLTQDPMLHLKAPVGGFRFKFQHLWADDKPLPKPSPTVMYNMRKNSTAIQIKGYKLYLFFKLFIREKPLNLFSFRENFQLRWNRSEFWAKKIGKESM